MVTEQNGVGITAPGPFHARPREGRGAQGKRSQGCCALSNSLTARDERALWASQRTKAQTLPSRRPQSSRRNWAPATVAQLTETALIFPKQPQNSRAEADGDPCVFGYYLLLCRWVCPPRAVHPQVTTLGVQLHRATASWSLNQGTLSSP